MAFIHFRLGTIPTTPLWYLIHENLGRFTSNYLKNKTSASAIVTNGLHCLQFQKQHLAYHILGMYQFLN
jgi:hypothetical protein